MCFNKAATLIIKYLCKLNVVTKINELFNLVDFYVILACRFRMEPSNQNKLASLKESGIQSEERGSVNLNGVLPLSRIKKMIKMSSAHANVSAGSAKLVQLCSVSSIQLFLFIYLCFRKSICVLLRELHLQLLKRLVERLFNQRT